ncbi:MAG: HAMP domain-containing sensor histidine kinase [Patescibacteria group bacterium]
MFSLFRKKKKIDLDDLTAVVHQFRAPLTAIRWVFDSLKKTSLSGEQTDLMKTGSQVADQLSTMVDDVMNLSKMESGRLEYKIEQVDLTELLSQQIAKAEPVGMAYNVKIFLEPASGKPMVNGDRKKLEIVFSNLIGNAIKYNNSGGTVSIKIEPKEKELLVSVKDTGKGIPPEAISKLFGKFFRASNVENLPISGSGFGLYIVKKIVEKHGGKIWAESELGKGSAFFVALPLK